MPTDQDRLATLGQATSNANPNGYVAILVRDLQWLLDAVNNRPGLRLVSPEPDKETTDDSE